MLFGAAGMMVTMAMLAVTTAPSITNPVILPNGMDGEARNKAPGYAAAVLLFVFNSCFAIGWLGMTWLYPAEITNTRIRAAANGVSTSANWLFNFLVVMITPILFEKIKYQTYLVFMCTNAAILVTTYFIFPETAGRSLEEMDDIFARSSYLNPFDVVRKEQQTPRRYDKSGRPLGLEELIAEGGYGHAEKQLDNPDLDTRDAASSN